MHEFMCIAHLDLLGEQYTQSRLESYRRALHTNLCIVAIKVLITIGGGHVPDILLHINAYHYGDYNGCANRSTTTTIFFFFFFESIGGTI